MLTSGQPPGPASAARPSPRAPKKAALDRGPIGITNWLTGRTCRKAAAGPLDRALARHRLPGPVWASRSGRGCSCSSTPAASPAPAATSFWKSSAAPAPAPAGAAGSAPAPRALPWEARGRRTPGHPLQDWLIKRQYGTGKVPCEPPSSRPIVQLVTAAPGMGGLSGRRRDRESWPLPCAGQGCFRPVRSRYSQSMTVVPVP
jgi:hypothetical protein